MGRPCWYAPEVRERAVRMVREHAAEYPSQWTAMRSIAETIGCTHEARRRSVRTEERDQGQSRRDDRRAPEVAGTERENAELKRANELLRKASEWPSVLSSSKPLTGSRKQGVH